MPHNLNSTQNLEHLEHLEYVIIRLLLTHGIGAKTAFSLLSAFNLNHLNINVNINDIFNNLHLLSLSSEIRLTSAQVNALKTKPENLEEYLIKHNNWLNSRVDHHFIHIFDEHYPKALLD